jgi:hypothetical protein
VGGFDELPDSGADRVEAVIDAVFEVENSGLSAEISGSLSGRTDDNCIE